MHKIPIGISNFQKLRAGDYYLVDKSMMIAEIVRSGAEVTLLPRPRRFGKTLNLSMLNSFFRIDESNATLFNGLAVSEHEDVMNHCGTYPTVFLTFKDIKFNDFGNCLNAMGRAIAGVFQEVRATLKQADPQFVDKEDIENIMRARAEPVALQNSLALLTRLLHRATGKKVVVLIDEYDMPIHTGFHNGYYAEIIEFMRNLLSGALKDNDHLYKGVLTGILRIAKESIFSGFNNPRVRTILDDDYSEFFGFTQHELDRVLADFDLQSRSDEARRWYNGYRFGRQTIYNPWSIMQYVTDARRPESHAEPYWVNTSDNLLIRDLVTENNAFPKHDLEALLRGETVHKELETNIVLSDINTDSLWSMLTFSGYLTPRRIRIKQGIHHCDLAIPNLEVRTFYERTVMAWVRKQTGAEGLKLLLDALLKEDMDLFGHHFGEAVRQALSYHDTAGNAPERVYQAFLLGILISLQDRYQVRSNRESGFGRYDIMLIPREPTGTGFVFEFKQTESNLQQAAIEALNQIRERDYAAESRQAGVKRMRAIGVALCGKQAHLETTLI